MVSAFFHTAFYDPIYNALVTLVAFVPGGDVGVAVILLTIVIRAILLPFSLSAARTQRAMRRLEPQLKALKEQHKDSRETLAKETLALYREARVNPFASILMVFAQIPVLFALYWVFLHESFTNLHAELLYSFTPTPEAVSLAFLGLVSVAGKSLILAFVAGASQYLQARFALMGSMKPSGGTGMQADFQRIMGFQLTYVFPILIAVISYTTSVAIALYLITTNIVGVFQEIYVRRSAAREEVQGR